MFDRIAKHYDFLNHFLSLGIDIKWRKKAIAKIPRDASAILDVATGTGDVAFMISRKFPQATITGMDLANGMLQIAREKQQKRKGTSNIAFIQGDSENLAFESNSYDAVTVAFGVRNFEHLDKGLAELFRVTKPGGKAVILEFTRPTAFPFKQLFNLYFRNLLPLIGKLRSKDDRAYKYLYESVQAFPDNNLFCQKLADAGWKDPQYQSLTLGICAIYTATK